MNCASTLLFPGFEEPAISFSRHWAMPSKDTFDCNPIGAFVLGYLSKSNRSVDPFSRNTRLATIRNDLNPNCLNAGFHMQADDFLMMLRMRGEQFDLALLDPPYSPRQISECYAESGLKAGMADTQNAALYSRVKDALIPLMAPNAIVLSFGWNSVGMGKRRGFHIIEIQLVCHGGAHNDTICIAERRTPLTPTPE